MGDWWRMKSPNLRDANKLGSWEKLEFDIKPDCRYGTTFARYNDSLYLYGGHGSKTGDVIHFLLFVSYFIFFIWIPIGIHK